MRILFYGAKGWIGGQFKDYLQQRNETVIEGIARVDDIPAVRMEIDQNQPTHVVSMIGRTSGEHEGKFYNTIDYLEQEGTLDINLRDNLFSPLVLALICEQRGIHFTYLGTGCIFQYDHNHDPLHGFTEEDLPNFTGSSYSTVKGYTDRLMHLFPQTVLNLRIRMPISHLDHPRNFISKIIRYQKICSIPNSMTVLETFFPVWWGQMIDKITGTFNCTNPGVITHDEILQIYKEEVDPHFKWENFSLIDQSKILSAGRSNNFLDTNKISDLCPLPPPEIHEAVKDVLKRWQK